MIRDKLTDGQEIIITTLGRGKSKHFSVWLCQGKYNEENDEYGTQFHIADWELDFWIKKLIEIRDKNESIKGELYK